MYRQALSKRGSCRIQHGRHHTFCLLTVWGSNGGDGDDGGDDGDDALINKPPFEAFKDMEQKTLKRRITGDGSNPTTETAYNLRPAGVARATQIAPVSANVTYNPKATPQFGTFKVAFFAQTSPPLPGFPPSGSVVMKQSLHQKPPRRSDLRGHAGNCSAHDDRSSNAHAPKNYTLVESGQQVINLEREILCNPMGCCADGLMRYVLVALAMEKKESPDRRVFMLEERIDSKIDGPWRKLRNTSEFLVFCQHVQYQETKGMVFVSDFQGGDTLLSDPQLLTKLSSLQGSETGMYYALGRPGSSNAKGKGKATEPLFQPTLGGDATTGGCPPSACAHRVCFLALVCAPPASTPHQARVRMSHSQDRLPPTHATPLHPP
ncbi:hypothetical protein C2E23DRAFT_908040 [Lenzites betulinus]|nr:hypothetical protein C2E23DRAFT_908040 [Lenzites betulinus]